MNVIRRHWYNIGLILAIGLLALAAIVGMNGLQLIVLLGFVSLLLHQLEEYGLPGGEAWILNEVFQPKGGPADRFPLNQNNAFFINVALWPVMLVPVFFPNLPWLAMGPLLFNAVGQFVVHGVRTNKQLKTIYNPGFATVLFCFIPVTIWYLIAAYNEGLVDWWQWLFTLLYTVPAMALAFVIGYGPLQHKDSKYPFDADEMGRFDRTRRLNHAGITPLPYPITDEHTTH
ncbi:MAG: HXXEE domain-containing protein [Microbacterium gubbeenense]